MKRTNIAHERVVFTREDATRDLEAYSLMLDHAIKRREEIRRKAVHSANRTMRGKILGRLGNEIDSYRDNIALLRMQLDETEG